MAEPDARVQLELSPVEGGIEGRFVVEAADPEVMTAALKEAMRLLAGAVPAEVDVWLWAPAREGSVVTVVAWVEENGQVCAAASGERGKMLAEAASPVDRAEA